MQGRYLRDAIGGGALILLGGATAIHVLFSLRVGSVTSMGPGMFPIALGVILVGLGAAILVPALLKARAGAAVPGGEAELPDADVRSLVCLLGAILAFALLARSFGIVPAIFALVFIARLADSKLSLVGAGLVATGLSLGAILVFQVGLGLQFPAIAWPW